MNQERMLKVLLGPHISEKSTSLSEQKNQFIFKVAKDSTKLEIKKTVESLFKVDVKNVTTLNILGKSKRTSRGVVGRRKSWKKAIVFLQEGQDIDFSQSTV